MNGSCLVHAKMMARAGAYKMRRAHANLESIQAGVFIARAAR